MGYSLSEIVNEYLIEAGFGQNNQFARFYQFGVSFLRRTNFNTTGFPKIKELTINDNDTADLPSDYARYLRIALCSNGILYSLGRNDDLCLNKVYNDCGNPVAHTDNNSSEEIGTTYGVTGVSGFLGNQFPADNIRNGEFMGRMFGIGADNNCFGYFRIDQNSNQIQFSNLSQTSNVVLEYLADINATPEGDFTVHPFCVEALKDWMAWKYKQRSSKPSGEQQLAERNFNNSNRLMRMMFMSSTNSEWVAAFATTNMAAPKL